MRNNGVEPDGDLLSVDFVPNSLIPLDRRSPEQKASDLNDMLQWLRNGKDDLDDPYGNFRRIDQILPSKKGQSPLERVNEMDKALNWIRIKGTSPPFDEESFHGFPPFGSIPFLDTLQRLVSKWLTTFSLGSEAASPTISIHRASSKRSTSSCQPKPDKLPRTELELWKVFWIGCEITV